MLAVELEADADAGGDAVANTHRAELAAVEFGQHEAVVFAAPERQNVGDAAWKRPPGGDQFDTGLARTGPQRAVAPTVRGNVAKRRGEKLAADLVHAVRLAFAAAST